jgi:hypothetical protein
VIDPGTTRHRLRLEVAAGGNRRPVGAGGNVLRRDEHADEPRPVRDALSVADHVDPDQDCGQRGERQR